MKIDKNKNKIDNYRSNNTNAIPHELSFNFSIE